MKSTHQKPVPQRKRRCKAERSRTQLADEELDALFEMIAEGDHPAQRPSPFHPALRASLKKRGQRYYPLRRWKV